MKEKTRILFICHGNICRSPMAEFIMKELVRKAGLEDRYEIASAATSAEEIGNPVYPPARRELAAHGISCKGKTARQITRRDYADYDHLIAMEQYNLRNIRRRRESKRTGEDLNTLEEETWTHWIGKLWMYSPGRSSGRI